MSIKKLDPAKVWVVAENQLFGWCACDVIDGLLRTYATQEEAQKEAEGVIDELHTPHTPYDDESWGAILLEDAIIGDNVDFIIFPYGSWKPYLHFIVSIKEYRDEFPNQKYD